MIGQRFIGGDSAMGEVNQVRRGGSERRSRMRWVFVVGEDVVGAGVAVVVVVVQRGGIGNLRTSARVVNGLLVVLLPRCSAGAERAPATCGTWLLFVRRDPCRRAAGRARIGAPLGRRSSTRDGRSRRGEGVEFERTLSLFESLVNVRIEFVLVDRPEDEPPRDELALLGEERKGQSGLSQLELSAYPYSHLH